MGCVLRTLNVKDVLTLFGTLLVSLLECYCQTLELQHMHSWCNPETFAVQITLTGRIRKVNLQNSGSAEKLTIKHLRSGRSKAIKLLANGAEGEEGN